MPLYDYKCKCGHVEVAQNKIDDRETHAPSHCDEQMRMIITGSYHIAPVLGGGGFQGYKCPITDKFVTSRRERRNIIAEHGVVEAG